MILWFLRLFIAFRTLEAAFRALEAQQDAASEAITEAIRLRELAAESAEEIEDLTNQLKSAEHDVASLREAHEELTTEKLRLQDRLDAAIEDKQNLWELVHSSLDGERYALHTQVNYATQRSGGGVPYPEASALPDERIAKLQKPGPVGRRGRMLPSQLAMRAERDNIRDNILRYAESISSNNPVEAET